MLKRYVIQMFLCTTTLSVSAQSHNNSKLHPDVAGALRAANTSRQYHIERINCMDGTVAQRHEGIRNNPPNYPVANPPVGEYCVALMRNSADVENSPTQINTRPEKSLLAPYLGMMATRGFEGSRNSSQALVNQFVTRATSPRIENISDVHRFGTGTQPFALVPGVALDAAFTQTVLNARQPNAPRPVRPARSLEELYTLTDKCFRRSPDVTLGKCADAGRDQAALYLNGL